MAYEANNLFAGDYPRRYAEVTVDASQTLVRGSAVGIITASGRAVILDTAAADGSEDFYGVCIEPVTTGVGETAITLVAISGDFFSHVLSFGGTTTVADVRNDMRDKNCYVHDSYADEEITGA